jgi:serine/threonine-protein kinase HipA
MNKCPITYGDCDELYSRKGLSGLSPRLSRLEPLPYTAQEQRQEAASRAVKMSVQGVQPKLSARLSAVNSVFEIVDQNGTYIIKPQSDLYLQVPENEDLTMKMASIFGIDVPLTGLVYSKDGSLSYFIRRFDRYAKNKKYHVEDFAQLTNNTRDTKYNWSMEKLIPVIENFCSFPLLEKRKLFRRVLFCFITGNEDMHLKNFSLITRGSKVELTPAYDFLNTTIATGNALEEMALPIAGKKRKVTRKLLFEYYAAEKMKLNEKTIKSEYQNLIKSKPELEKLIGISFLTPEMKTKYIDLLNERFDRMIK